MQKLAICILLTLSFQAINAQLNQRILQAINQIEPACIEWRRQIHQYPELGYHEVKTGKLIAGHLRELGMEVKGSVTEREWVTGAEDFSYFGTKAPSFFFYLGGMPKGADSKKAAPHHTPGFYIEDTAMKSGVKAFCQLVTDYLNMK